MMGSTPIDWKGKANNDGDGSRGGDNRFPGGVTAVASARTHGIGLSPNDLLLPFCNAEQVIGQSQVANSVRAK